MRRIPSLTVFYFEEAFSNGSVYLVPVDGMIDGGLSRYIERATNDALEADAALIIYHVDTVWWIG